MLKVVKNSPTPREITREQSLLSLIEAALFQHPAVKDAAVDLVWDKKGRPLLVAYVVPSTPELSPGALKNFIYRRPEIPWNGQPRRYLLLPAIPRTPSGKLQRQKLINSYLQAIDSSNRKNLFSSK
ncbi:AMP-binding enzyme [Desulfofundulus thermosubterraneus]|uniref:AMP-binding enzyme C-terminal domain-containing protein n=1 Tax=Desulfofundulus thermosubterraneus DSM 16057 TaxID=1121432 RepID=A0A1M6BTS9_9FIRM|nr:hypothetical protein [Desulfofundulus thermosubterraneus]SHI52146.1 AMP-binding enzyme C-terminal domain-containing protein [Desulfofundulus thermosubterraneus DSM 16057]